MVTAATELPGNSEGQEGQGVRSDRNSMNMSHGPAITNVEVRSTGPRMSNRSLLLTILGIVGVLPLYVLAIIVSGAAPGANEGSLTRWVEGAGPAAPLVFTMLLAGAVVVAPIPNTPFFIVAGAIWGPVLGSVYSMTGMLAGSFIALLLARSIPRATVRALIPPRARIRLEATPEATKPWILFWARLLPATNFDWANYVAGLTSIRSIPFLVATFAGIAPATIATVVVGSALHDDPVLAVTVTVAWLIGAGASLVYVIRRERNQ